MSAQPPEDSGAKSDADPAAVANPSADDPLRSALAAMINNLAVLTHELDGAAQLSLETQALDGGRVGCMMALKAVVEFCDRARLGPERRRPLMQLILALESAEKGAIDPLLKVQSRSGAPPLTEAERRQRGCLAAAMEALMRDGVNANDAARWVANRSRKMRAARRIKTDLWRVVKGWRVAAMGGNKAEDRDTLTYYAACEVLGQGIAVGQQGAEALLRIAAAEGTI